MSGARRRGQTGSIAASGGGRGRGQSGDNRRWRIGLVIALVLAGCALSVEDAPAAFAASPTWSVAASYPAPAASLNGVACPSATTCFAVGVLGSSTGSIDVTANGGTTWTTQTVPAGTGALAGIACPTTSTCEAVGQSTSSRGIVLGTTNGGTTWTAQSVPSGSVALDGVSCPSAANCVAVGVTSGGVGVVLSTANGGTTWSKRTVPGGTGTLASVSCASSSVCAAVGGLTPDVSIVTTTTGGSSWTAQSVPSTVGTLTAVSCPTTGLCEAVGADTGILSGVGMGVVVASVSSGPWTSQSVPPGLGDLSAVSCATSSVCAAVGGEIITTTNAGTGATWNSQSLPATVNVLAAVSCPSTTVCEAGGGLTTGLGAVVGTTAPSTSWSLQTLPYAVNPFTGSVCPTSSDCFAVGADTTGGAIYASTNGGQAWSKQTVPSGVASLSAVGCANSTTCEAAGAAAGGGGAMLGTTNGSTWSSQSVPATLNDIISVSCPSTSDCTAVGTDLSGNATIIATTDGGTTWNGEAIPSGVSPSSVSCPTTSECVAVGSLANSTNASIITTSDSGVMWTNSSSLPSAGPLGGVSCSGALNCTAVGYSFSNEKYAPAILSTGDASSATSSWSSANVPSGTATLVSVSCTTSTSCEAIGATTTLVPTAMVTSNGTTWATQPLPAEPGLLQSVSCATAGVCVAGGGGRGTVGGMLLSYSVPSTVPPAPFFPVSPTRICDTRPTAQSGLTDQCTANTLGRGGTLSVQVTGEAGVPSGATAVVANVTVTNPTAAGYLIVYPAGTPRPLVSNVNFSAGQTVPNLVTVPLSPGGAIDVFNSGSSTDVLVDVTGYYAPGTGAGLVPLPPSRICDTRPTSQSGITDQCTGKNPGAGGNSQTLAVQVTGQGGVPSGASAVVANLTVVSPSSGGYLTAYPAGTTKPLASNVNFAAGQTVPNRVIVPLSHSGVLDIFNSGGSSNVIVDVTGYFSTSATGYFEALTPARICDSRPASQSGITDQCTGKTLGNGANSETLTVQVTGFGGVPTGAAAVVANVTATGPSAAGYLTVYPAGTSRPVASDLNFTAGQTVANLVVAELGGSGGLAVFNAGGSNDVIVDVAGWFT